MPAVEGLLPCLLVAGVFMPPALQTGCTAVWALWAWRNLGFRTGREPRQVPSGDNFTQWWGRLALGLGGMGLAQCLLFLLTAVSLLWSRDVTEGLVELNSKVPWLVWPLAGMAAAPRLHSWRQQVTLWVWVSGLTVSVLCVADVLLRSSSPAHWFQDTVYENLAYRSGLHPLYLSVWMLMSMIAYTDQQILQPQGNSGHPVWRITKHILVLTWMTVFLTQLSSRMALLNAAMILILSLWWFRRPLLRRPLIAASLVLLGLLPLLLIQNNAVNRSRFGEMVDMNRDYTQNQWGGRSLRLHKWKFTLLCYTQNPFLGSGAGDFQADLEQTYQAHHFEVGRSNHFNSHNQYLQTLATLGPLGLALLLCWLVAFLYLGWKNRDWAVIAMGLVMAGSMLTESILERQHGLYILGILTNGYFYSLRGPQRPVLHEPPATKSL